MSSVGFDYICDAQRHFAVIKILPSSLEETDQQTRLNICQLLAKMHADERSGEGFNVDAKYVKFADIVWEGSALGSSRRAEAGIALAKLHLRGLWTDNPSITERAIGCLREILSSSPGLPQVNEAKFLLAQWYSTTRTPLVSYHEAVKYCESVHNNVNLTLDLRQQAFDWLTREGLRPLAW